ncbi:MAG: hypothetical protein Q4C95_06930 [Planctomycetia bacterium]|nr:hypothetical protein [Planctomycetia bacterium]
MFQLTQEDELLIELLVDGELEEPARRELLVRLDRIEGGWRFCAIMFLEMQCCRETITKKWNMSQQEQKSVNNFFYNDSLSNDPNKNKNNIQANLNSRQSFNGTSALDSIFETNSFDNDFLDRKALDKKNSTESNSFNKSSDQPLIIPIKKGGYSDNWNIISKRFSGGDGPTWRKIFAAMAGGFFFALLLTGFIALLVVHHPTAGPSPQLNNGVIAQNTPFSENNQNDNSSDPIHVVKLKSAHSDINGIEVPCFESKKDFASHSQRPEASNEFVEELRKKGHHVEEVYEELMFPLDDGRMIIVPVSTYNVKYHKSQSFQ